jgi:hypothetical protein
VLADASGALPELPGKLCGGHGDREPGQDRGPCTSQEGGQGGILALLPVQAFPDAADTPSRIGQFERVRTRVRHDELRPHEDRRCQCQLCARVGRRLVRRFVDHQHQRVHLREPPTGSASVAESVASDASSRQSFASVRIHGFGLDERLRVPRPSILGWPRDDPEWVGDIRAVHRGSGCERPARADKGRLGLWETTACMRVTRPSGGGERACMISCSAATSPLRWWVCC